MMRAGRRIAACIWRVTQDVEASGRSALQFEIFEGTDRGLNSECVGNGTIKTPERGAHLARYRMSRGVKTRRATIRDVRRNRVLDSDCAGNGQDAGMRRAFSALLEVWRRREAIANGESVLDEWTS